VKYAVTLGGRTFEVEIRGGEARVDGEAVHAVLHAVPGGPLRLLTLPDGVRTYALARSDGGWTVYAAGEVWESQVVDERTRRLQEVTGGGRAASGHAVVRAPMPGRVARVEVEVGSAVKQGQGVAKFIDPLYRLINFIQVGCAGGQYDRFVEFADEFNEGFIRDIR